MATLMFWRRRVAKHGLSFAGVSTLLVAVWLTSFQQSLSLPGSIGLETFLSFDGSVSRAVAVEKWRSAEMLWLVMVALVTDLLVGISLGLVVGFIFILFDHLRYPCYTVVSPPGSVLTRVRLQDQVSFLNKASLVQLLENTAPGSRIEVDGTACRHVDHDVLEFISDFRQTAELKRIDFRTVGLSLPPVSPSH